MHLTLHLTPGCNMRCDYCYAPPQPGEGMRTEVGEKALALGARLTTQEGSCGIVFFGGEPLLHQELMARLVGRAREMEAAGAGRFHFKATTNGLLLDEGFLRFAIDNDVLLAMSFDGVREAHDAHRRLAGGAPSFDLLLPRLQLLLSARPYSSVLLVVNPDTAPLLPESIEFLLGLGAQYLIVSLNYAAPWTGRELRALGRAYRRLGDLYLRWTREGRKFYLSPFEVKLSSHINRHCFQRERCELASRQLSVDPAGYLYPCVQFPRAGPASEWCFGHLDSGVDEGARLRIRERSRLEQESCRGCALEPRCNHTCGCLNWQATGAIDQVSPVLCAHERLLVPIVDRVGARLYQKRDPHFLHKHYNAAYPVLSAIEDALASPGTKP